VLNINDYYTTVQALLNEYRMDYASPDEFNKFAALAGQSLWNDLTGPAEQMQYNHPLPRVGQLYSRTVDEVLAPFHKSYPFSLDGTVDVITKPSDFGRRIAIISSDGKVRFSYVQSNRVVSRLNDPIDPVDQDNPIYTDMGSDYEIYPTAWTAKSFVLTYYSIPIPPKWAYAVNGDGEPVYNPGSSKNYEWHDDMFNNLVMRILGYFGINLNEQQLVAYSAQNKASGE
jgi:hypothetical protein